MIRNFINAVAMTSGKYREKMQKEAEAQKEEFRKEHPSLTARRAAAIEYLGPRWILAKSHGKLAEPRNF